MAAKLNRTLGLLAIVGIVVLAVYVMRAPNQPPRWKGQSAKLPCLTNSQCPMGQTCNEGFCAEGFMAPAISPTDMASCTAKECKGINAPCERRANPCAEGTFCQGNSCVSVTAPDQGEAYKQIGMLLD